MQYLPIRQKYDPSTLQNPLTSGESVAKYSNAIQKFLETKDQLSRSQGGQEGGVSPLTKWQLRNQAMMQSGNPILQQQAMKEQQTYATQMMQAQFREEPMSTAGRMAEEAGNPKGTTGFQDFVDRYAFKQGNVTNVNVGDQKYMSVDELNKLEQKDENGNWGQVKGGLTQDDFYSQSNAGNIRLRDDTSVAEAGKISSISLALDTFDEIEPMYYNEDGSINEEVLFGASAIDFAESLPWIFGSLASKATKQYFNPKASLIQNSMSQGIGTMLRLETGAEAPEHELTKFKNMFMPMKGEHPSLIKSKLKAYRSFLQMSKDLIDPRGKSDRKSIAQLKEHANKVLEDEGVPIPGESSSEPKDILPEGWTF